MIALEVYGFEITVAFMVDCHFTGGAFEWLHSKLPHSNDFVQHGSLLDCPAVLHSKKWDCSTLVVLKICKALSFDATIRVMYVQRSRSK